MELKELGFFDVLIRALFFFFFLTIWARSAQYPFFQFRESFGS